MCTNDEVNRFPDRLDLVGRVIGNVDVELFLKLHDQFYCVKGVGAKVFADVVSHGRTLTRRSGSTTRKSRSKSTKSSPTKASMMT